MALRSPCWAQSPIKPIFGFFQIRFSKTKCRDTPVQIVEKSKSRKCPKSTRIGPSSWKTTWIRGFEGCSADSTPKLPGAFLLHTLVSLRTASPAQSRTPHVPPPTGKIDSRVWYHCSDNLGLGFEILGLVVEILGAWHESLDVGHRILGL